MNTQISLGLYKLLLDRSEGYCECHQRNHGHGLGQCAISFGIDRWVFPAHDLRGLIFRKENVTWFVQFNEPWNEPNINNCELLCFYCFKLINNPDNINIEEYKNSVHEIRYQSGYRIATGNTLRKTNRPKPPHIG